VTGTIGWVASVDRSYLPSSSESNSAEAWHRAEVRAWPDHCVAASPWRSPQWTFSRPVRNGCESYPAA